MATFGYADLVRGFLKVEQAGADRAVGLFSPTQETLRAMRFPPDEVFQPVPVLELDSAAQTLTIRPIQTQPTMKLFGQPKYKILRRIVVPMRIDRELILRADADLIRDLLEGLPRGLTQNVQFGLGLPKVYAPLVEAMEEQTGCSTLRLGDGSSSVDADILTMSLDDFEAARAETDRIIGRANAAAANVKEAFAHNWISRVTGREMRPYKRGRHPMVGSIADAASGHLPINGDTVERLSEMLAMQAKQMPAARVRDLARLRQNVELAELDLIVERFEELLSSDGLPESTWQRFFGENPFVLSLVFGSPMVVIQGQASVGGTSITGAGGKITDFLAKNSVTNNIAIFEIKRPSTELLKEYRGVFAPAKELSGALVQVMDQRYQLQMEFPVMRLKSPDKIMESYAVKLCVIIGRMPEDPERIRSFEMFRGSMNGIQVVTFDELLQHVRILRDFLRGGPAGSVSD
ncbi:uncharacterized protein DUF4263 [Kribbella sp. VKM Ac-2569]|uniref:Shedu immune nuclease family protein n=1 Tax=Kribbella sp. VKM Ac-2569 TaxID=2512220 RepID=UPI0010E82DFC|nr:Shedu immune nuclease family protein [Kribbella sp. VKM Ac-2569]RZT07909.1 uncharacterized protein DUF4263 [Kribbella sp. VKM Ac-2569]